MYVECSLVLWIVDDSGGDVLVDEEEEGEAKAQSHAGDDLNEGQVAEIRPTDRKRCLIVRELFD